jgi:hypothetical protein
MKRPPRGDFKTQAEQSLDPFASLRLGVSGFYFSRKDAKAQRGVDYIYVHALRGRHKNVAGRACVLTLILKESRN